MANTAGSTAPKAPHYNITVKELKGLMELRGEEAYETIKTKYLGVQGLCNRLKTSATEGKHRV